MEVAFVSGQGNSIKIAKAEPGLLAYSVNGTERPPIRRVLYRARLRRLEFPGSSNKPTTLPLSDIKELLVKLQGVAEAAGVEHNFAKEEDSNERADGSNRRSLSNTIPLTCKTDSETALGGHLSATYSASVKDTLLLFEGSNTLQSTKLGTSATPVQSPRSPIVTSPQAPRSPVRVTSPVEQEPLEIGDAVIYDSSGKVAKVVGKMECWGRYEVELDSGETRWRDRRGLDLVPRVAVCYDKRMEEHEPAQWDRSGPDTDLVTPERPTRISAVWKHLERSGLLPLCNRIPCKEAPLSDLHAVHTRDHVARVQRCDLGSVRDENNEVEMFLSTGSPMAARLAVGGLLEVVSAVLEKRAPCGFAVVRPPGHHAERTHGMGFCFYNNVAIAARRALDRGVRRVFVLDWDVHHGNGIQNEFYDDPSVLYLSLHVLAAGRFYPGTGRIAEVGGDGAKGYNVNIPWGSTGVGDAEYRAAFDAVVLPILKSFSPQLILVAAGFDAAQGDPLGECCVTSRMYGWMTRRLCVEAPTVLSLEGGYSLKALSEGVAACVESMTQLLFHPPEPPLPEAPWEGQGPWSGVSSEHLAVVLEVARTHVKFWPDLQRSVEILAEAVSEIRAHETAESLRERWRNMQ